MSTYGDCERLVPEDEMARIEEAVRRRVPLPDRAEFGAFRVVDREPPEFHLTLMSPHPGEIQRKAGAVHGTVSRGLLESWSEYQAENSHFVDKRDPLLMNAFMLMANRHHDELTQLRNTMN